ncbi:MAG TPA: PKD domain-containing protein, partial [Opitutaceae bacterium]|nr:PKD domain-containing protein [Opitutaceae bacterium]
LGDLEIRTRLALPEGAFETTKSVQWSDLFPPVILTIPARPKAGEQVRFVENTKSVYSTYEWHVDGQTAGTEKVLSWRFTDTRLHRVVLKVKGIDGRAQSSVVVIAASEKSAFTVELLAPASSLQPKETIQFVARPSEKAVRYRWEIDGEVGGTEPDFTWQPTREGNYTIKLTAWDAEDREAYQTRQVSVAEAPLTLQVKAPREATSGQSVQFVAEINGAVETLEWDFGDGTTSTQKNPQHTFNLSGNSVAEFAVSVRATSPAGRSVRSSSHPVRVEALMAIAAPVADFKVIESRLRVGDGFHLVNTSQGQIDSWQWEVSGEASPTERNPILRFSSAGEKTVTLTVKGPGGVHSISRKLVVQPRFSPVKLAVSASARSGTAPLRVAFTNQCSGDVKAWRWDFGDGHTSVEPSPEHEYVTHGEHTAKVTAIPADPDAAPVEQTFSLSIAKPWPLWAKVTLLLGIVASLGAIAAELLRRRRNARLRLPVFYWPHDSSICQRLDFTRADESQEISSLQVLLRRVGASSNLIAEARHGSVLIFPDGREEDTQPVAAGAKLSVRLSTGIRKTVALATHEKPKRPKPPEAEATVPALAEPDLAPVAVAATDGADFDWGWDESPRK